MNAYVTRLTLAVAGVLALGIGAAITFAPGAFYASYGIVLPAGADFYSEVRAPGTNLAILGALIFVGAFKADWARFSATLGTAVFLAYAAGRIVSIMLDGIPSDAILLALMIELVVGGLCALSLKRARRPSILEEKNRPAV
ncbi:DUF4345 domain-containing protein [Roseibium sp.]|uniref:DUF4345 domain-containing protein n=1 Tax=Roseibium sp. TaxID=1936156 RepID=UPI003BAA5A3C